MKDAKRKRVAVIGGGASGLVAAIMAQRSGADVVVIEQKEILGKKLLSTGNGRCNLTNRNMGCQYYRGEDLNIVDAVLRQFSAAETCSFFQELGVLTKDRNGYIYPLTGHASDVRTLLCRALPETQVELYTNRKVTAVSKCSHGFLISCQDNSTPIAADAVILSCGGCAASALGSDGSGYALAEALGHTLTPIVPALVQLRSTERYFKKLSGIRTDACVTVLVDQQELASDSGELQLTDYGISGIPVFQISRYASLGIYRKQTVQVKIDFLPSITEPDVRNLLQERRKKHPSQTIEELLTGIFHKKLIAFFLWRTKIAPDSMAIKLSDQRIRQLVTAFKSCMIPIEAANPFAQAQVCAGGVRTSEVHAETMESCLVDNLYLTGELLDIDGICGGYNLQWAWSTGYIAGMQAGKKKSDTDITEKTRGES